MMMAMSTMIMKIMMRMVRKMRMVMLMTNKEQKRYLAAVWNGVSPYWGGRIIYKEHLATCANTLMLLYKACVKTFIFR